MVKCKALMESLSSNLHGFLEKTNQNLSMLDKKFLWDGLIGLLRAGQPIVCQTARHLPDQRTKFISRLDRLDEHLVRNSNFDNNVKEVLPGVDYAAFFLEISLFFTTRVKRFSDAVLEKKRQRKIPCLWQGIPEGAN